MKKFINARFPLLLVFALIAGILLGYLFIRIQISLFYIIAIVPAAAVIYIFCTVFSRKKLLLYCTAAILAFTLGVIGSYIKLDGYNTGELTSGDTYSISATVREKGKYDGGEYLIIKNVVADGQKIKGKMKVYLSSEYGEYCDAGYDINFTAKVYAYDAFAYGKLNYNALKNIKYRCNVYGEITSSYHFSLFGTVNSAIRNALYGNLGYDTASVAYAMLTGNTDGVEDGSMSAFRYGGVAHVFAVSGLHIGILYGLLQLLCKKTRLNRYAALAVCFIPLILYAGVCGFTLSSVRALIMCAVAAVAQTLRLKYDALNSLSLAATAILLINPLNLFNSGFQLSVCAVSGIVLLAKNVTRPFKKVPRKIKDAIGISLSAQAGTLPVMLARFGYISGAGLLLNIVIIPLLSAVFAVIFIATLLSVILPFAAPLLSYAALPLELIISFLTDAGFEKSLISGFGAGAFTAVYFVGILFLSDKINIRLKYRLTAVICAVALLCVYVPVKTFSPFNGHKIIVSAFYGGGQVAIKSSEGNILILTENIYISRVDSFLNDYYASDLTAIIILGGENCAQVYANSDFDCDAYVFGGYVNVQPFANKNISYQMKFSVNGVDFEFVDGYSLLAKCDGATLGICAGNYIPFDCCDLLFTDSKDECNAQTIVSFNERSFENCVYDDGDITFKTKR